MILEDEQVDVLVKAARGCGITLDENLSLTKKVQLLHLDLNALLGLASYDPEIYLPEEINCYVTDFGHIGVNAWSVGGCLFDTGTDGGPILSELEDLKCIAITHGHRDHVGGYEFLRPRVDEAYCPEDLPVSHAEPLKHGDVVKLGKYRYRCLNVSGHAIPTHAPRALAYYTDESTVPVCVVGDAIFAGSMGGCTNPDQYRELLANVKDHVLTLPEDTILLPGHGPATTLRQELRSNPFLAGA